MKKILQRSFADIKVLAINTVNTGTRLVETTSSMTEGHINNLRGQLDGLWKMAEESPRRASAEIVENVERMLADLRAWKNLGLPGEFAVSKVPAGPLR